MKAVVGVGSKGQCLIGLDLYLRLGLSNPEAVLVYVVESVLPDGGFLPESAASPIADIQRQRKEDGSRLLEEVAHGVREKGVACKTLITFGNPAHAITEIAEKENADLIVAGSGKKGKLEAFIMGSVTRALVSEAKRSILVAKASVADGRPLNVVFATDHSEYAARCASLFVKLAPTGIGKMDIVTADTMDPGVRDVVDNAEGITHGEMLTRKNDAVRKTLLPVCNTIETHMVAGEANDAIDEVMKLTKADLLVIGAHGHGFLERMVMGSTAMHMVGNSPWNVLVLRA